jgi:hypothetical protein
MGRKRVYASEREREQAKVAHRREKRQQQAAHRNGQVRYNIPIDSQLLIGPSIRLPPFNYEQFYYYKDQNIAVQIEDEFDRLLPLQSPILGSASMDISEPESEEPDIGDPIAEPEPIIEQENAEFIDIDELVPNDEAGGQSVVEKLSIQLANQLIQF